MKNLTPGPLSLKGEGEHEKAPSLREGGWGRCLRGPIARPLTHTSPSRPRTVTPDCYEAIPQVFSRSG